jgi:hypothetical protein
MQSFNEELKNYNFENLKIFLGKENGIKNIALQFDSTTQSKSVLI